MPKRYYDADRWDDGDDTVRCYQLRFHLEEIREECLTQRRLYPAVPDKGSSVFWCRHHDEPYEKGEGCGRLCAAYAPRNGKNGRCRHSAHCYDAETDNAVLLKSDGTVEPFPHKGLTGRVIGAPGFDMEAAAQKARRDTRSVVEVMEDLARAVRG